MFSLFIGATQGLGERGEFLLWTVLEDELFRCFHYAAREGQPIKIGNDQRAGGN